MIRRVYIAAPFARYKEANTISQQLQDDGFLVRDDWMITAKMVFENESKPDERDEAEGDISDIEYCDCLVSLHFEGEGRGMYYEMGYAMKMGIPVIMLGARNECIFQTLHTHVEDYDGLLKALRGS